MALTSKDEYLKASRGLATGFGPTTDFADKQVGATAQSKDGIGVSQTDLPGQVFSVDQLPDPAVAKAYGLPPVTIPENLILESTEDAENHIQGKDVLDIASAQMRRQLDDPTLTFDNKVASAEDSLKSFSERTGANAGAAAKAVEAEDEKQDEGETDNGKPVDPEGVQQPDTGGTKAGQEKADQADDKVQKADSSKSGQKQGKNS